MHPQRTLPLHRRLKRPRQRSFFCPRPAVSAAIPPRTMSAAVPSSLAPHDSKARLISVTIRRDSWRSHVHRTHTAQRVQFFKLQTRNVGGRGARPLVLSLGGLGGYSLSRKRVSPFIRAAPSAALPAAPVPQLPLHLCEKTGAILSRERISPLPGSSAKRCITPPRIARISQCPFGHKKRAIRKDGSHFRSISQRC